MLKLADIAVYLITFLKLKWKNKQIKVFWHLWQEFTIDCLIPLTKGHNAELSNHWHITCLLNSSSSLSTKKKYQSSTLLVSWGKYSHGACHHGDHQWSVTVGDLHYSNSNPKTFTEWLDINSDNQIQRLKTWQVKEMIRTFWGLPAESLTLCHNRGYMLQRKM